MLFLALKSRYQFPVQISKSERFSLIRHDFLQFFEKKTNCSLWKSLTERILPSIENKACFSERIGQALTKEIG